MEQPPDDGIAISFTEDGRLCITLGKQCTNMLRAMSDRDAVMLGATASAFASLFTGISVGLMHIMQDNMRDRINGADADDEEKGRVMDMLDTLISGTELNNDEDDDDEKGEETTRPDPPPVGSW